ncbi:MAG: hypothetical protein JWP97_3034, partial [Labilithrix sp.]|nr:hypothetical protein [Labilithrix sp.]
MRNAHLPFALGLALITAGCSKPDPANGSPAAPAEPQTIAIQGTPAPSAAAAAAPVESAAP